MLEVKWQDAVRENTIFSCRRRWSGPLAKTQIAQSAGVRNEIRVSGATFDSTHVYQFVRFATDGIYSRPFFLILFEFYGPSNAAMIRMVRHQPARMHSVVAESAFLIKFYCCKWFSLESCAGFVHVSCAFISQSSNAAASEANRLKKFSVQRVQMKQMKCIHENVAEIWID